MRLFTCTDHADVLLAACVGAAQELWILETSSGLGFRRRRSGEYHWRDRYRSAVRLEMGNLTFNNRFLVYRCCSYTFPQIDIIGDVVIVWRVRGKTIRSVLCNIVCNNCAQCDAHTYEQT